MGVARLRSAAGVGVRSRPRRRAKPPETAGTARAGSSASGATVTAPDVRGAEIPPPPLRPPATSWLPPQAYLPPGTVPSAGYLGTHHKGPPTALVPSSVRLAPNQATPRRRQTTSRRHGRRTRSTTPSRIWPWPCRLSWRHWRGRPSSEHGQGPTRSSSHAWQASWRQQVAFDRLLFCWIPGRPTDLSVHA